MAEPGSKIPVKSEKRSSLSNLFAPTVPSWGRFDILRREVDQLFDRFRESSSRLAHPSSFFDFGWASDAGSSIAPAVDVVEKDKEYEITAELPGLDDKNIEVKLSNGMLLIKGEKKEEREERDKDYLSFRTPLWRLHPVIPDSGQRRYGQDRGKFLEGLAHHQAAEIGRGDEE